jgi:GNAT superfamily N-acetyltransferase
VNATDDDLYRRGAETAVACWAEYARTTPAAAVHRLPGVDVAVFPEGPERAVFNNAIPERGLTGAARSAAVEAMADAYAAAGVASYAAWAHESDVGLRDELTDRGFTHQETTWAMGMVLDGLPPEPPVLDLGPDDWAEYLRILELPAGLLVGADPAAFHVLVARLDGTGAATAMAYDHADDCGLYNIGTLEHARRRGLGAGLVATHLHRARARGRLTATLQSTEMARGVYASVGFRDLGRILEYGPPVQMPSRKPAQKIA